MRPTKEPASTRKTSAVFLAALFICSTALAETNPLQAAVNVYSECLVNPSHQRDTANYDLSLAINACKNEASQIQQLIPADIASQLLAKAQESVDKYMQSQ